MLCKRSFACAQNLACQLDWYHQQHFVSNYSKRCVFESIIRLWNFQWYKAWYVIFWIILVHTLFVFGLVQSASKAVQFTSFKHCFWHSINEKFASRFGLIIIILFPGFSAKLSLIFQSPAIQPKVDWLSIVSQKGTFYINSSFAIK